MSADSTLLLAALLVGLVLIGSTWVLRRAERRRELADVIGLSAQEAHEEPDPETPSRLVEGTVGLAGRLVERLDAKGSVVGSLERARIPLRPGEFVIVAMAGGLALAALLLAVTGQWLFGVLAVAAAPLGGIFVVRRRVKKRRKALEAQLPGALTLIASSLSAGHTFLRAIQMMCEESGPPLSEEFSRVVAESRLGDPVVDAVGRMAERLQIRDLDWVVQAIRIQQTVGGRLAELLHTLADFIRAREEVRREVDVLTAEGRISGYVLGAMPPFLLLAIQVVNPAYMKPMFSGVGLIVLGACAASVAFGTLLIFRMVKIDV